MSFQWSSPAQSDGCDFISNVLVSEDAQSVKEQHMTVFRQPEKPDCKIVYNKEMPDDSNSSDCNYVQDQSKEHGVGVQYEMSDTTRITKVHVNNDDFSLDDLSATDFELLDGDISEGSIEAEWIFEDNNDTGAEDHTEVTNNMKSEVTIKGNQDEVGTDFAVVEADSSLNGTLPSLGSSMLKGNLRGNQSVFSTLKAKVTKKSGNKAMLLDHVVNLHGHLDDKDSILSNMAIEKKELAEKIAKMQTEVSGLRDNHASASNDLKTLRTQLDEKCEDLDRKDGALSGIAREKEELAEKLAKMQSELQSAQSHLLKPTAAVTSTIMFDDVTTKQFEVITSYHGLNWKNIRAYKPDLSRDYGFKYGLVSGNYVALINVGQTGSISSASPFSVKGFKATAGYNNNLSVRVQSFDHNGILIGNKTIILGNPRDGPTFIDLQGGDFDNFYKLKIESSGGTKLLHSRSLSSLIIGEMYVTAPTKASS